MPSVCAGSPIAHPPNTGGVTMGRPRQADLKTSFMVDRTWHGALQKMNDAQVASWCRACFAFANGLDAEVQDPAVLVLYQVFRDYYTANEIRYRERCNAMQQVALERESKKRAELARLEALKREFPELLAGPDDDKA